MLRQVSFPPSETQRLCHRSVSLISKDSRAFGKCGEFAHCFQGTPGLGRMQQARLTLHLVSFHSDQFRSCQLAATLCPCCSHLIPLWASFVNLWNSEANSGPSRCYHRLCRSRWLRGVRCLSRAILSLPCCLLPAYNLYLFH